MNDTTARHPFATKTGIEAMCAIMIARGSMCPACGHGTKSRRSPPMSSPAMRELKPCPFCGSKSYLMMFNPNDGVEQWEETPLCEVEDWDVGDAYINCTCGIVMNMEASPRIAVTNWNRRAVEAQPEPDVEALAKLFSETQMAVMGCGEKFHWEDVIPVLQEPYRAGIRAVLAALNPVCHCPGDTGVRTESGWHCAECGLPKPAEPECCVWALRGGESIAFDTGCGSVGAYTSRICPGCGKPIRLAGEERP